MSRLRQSDAAHKLKKALFLRGNRGPANRWYKGYRHGELIRALKKPFHHDQLPIGYGRWLDERIIEYPWLFSRLSSGPGRLLDAGSILNHHFIISHPKLKNKDVTIMTLAPEQECSWQKSISYVYGDIRNMIFRDQVFDYVASISTLEHVGMDNQCFHSEALGHVPQELGSHLVAVREFARVLKPGGTCLITVPFGQAARQEWQQIFDAGMIEQLIQAFGPEAHSETYFRHYDEHGWKLCDKTAAADARYFNYRTDPPWEGHPAAAEAVVCLELRK